MQPLGKETKADVVNWHSVSHNRLDCGWWTIWLRCQFLFWLSFIRVSFFSCEFIYLSFVCNFLSTVINRPNIYFCLFILIWTFSFWSCDKFRPSGRSYLKIEIFRYKSGWFHLFILCAFLCQDNIPFKLCFKSWHWFEGTLLIIMSKSLIRLTRLSPTPAPKFSK